MKYGNLIYNKRNGRLNLGDDIQLIAVENMYKKMGINYDQVVRVEYTDLYSYQGEELIVPISFPIISYNSEMNITCFSDKIYPVFLGLSILTDSLNVNDKKYLMKFSPIGCRDIHTLNIMKKNQIPAYLFGCMTMTFPRKWVKDEKKGNIYCIDVSSKLWSYIPNSMKSRCRILSNAYNVKELTDSPENMARNLYSELIREAQLVITSRMHVALPCIAAGIPVIFAKDIYSYRFEGVDKVVKVYSEEEYQNIDWYPEPLYYENRKENMLKLAVGRVKDMFETYAAILELEKIDDQSGLDDKGGVIESTYHTKRYLDKMLSSGEIACNFE